MNFIGGLLHKGCKEVIGYYIYEDFYKFAQYLNIKEDQFKDKVS